MAGLRPAFDKAGTVTGDHYTFVPNPHYYDKSAVHWKKVVIRVITNPQSALNAVRTGQADVWSAIRPLWTPPGRPG